MFRKLFLSGFTLYISTVLSLAGCGGGGGNVGDKTGLNAPTVTASSPTNTSVSVAALITATFSAPMTESTIKATGSFTQTTQKTI